MEYNYYIDIAATAHCLVSNAMEGGCVEKHFHLLTFHPQLAFIDSDSSKKHLFSPFETILTEVKLPLGPQGGIS